MPAGSVTPTRGHVRRAAARPTSLLAGALLLALAFLAVDSAHRLRTIGAVSTLRVGAAPVPPRDPASPTGYAHGQHRLVLPATGTDGYHWLLQTERMLAGDGLRIRRTDVDNAPHGREVHWSSPVRWWLGALAVTASRAGAVPAPQALERIAALAGPIALAVLLVALAPLVMRLFGAMAAAIFTLAWIAAFPLYEAFAAGIIDHHGPAAMSVAIALLLVAGGTLNPAAAPGRFRAAGIALGLGMWLSAATTIPVIAALCATALAGYALPATRAALPAPALWRAWGLAGALTTAAAWLLEYFPQHLNVRLEVNHPLHALAWLAAADLVARTGSLVRARAGAGGDPVKMASSAGDAALIALAAAVILLVPIVILATGDTTFRLADPFLRAVHDVHIAEFRSLAAHLAGASPLQVLQSVSALPLVLVPAAFAIAGGRLPARQRATVLVMAGPALALLVLAAIQVRWLGTASAALLAVLAGGAGVLSSPDGTSHAFGTNPTAPITPSPGQRRTLLLLLVLILLPLPALTALFPWRHGYPAATEARQLVTRDVAWQLRERLGDRRGVVASTPTTTTWLVWFGGFAGLGTLYWENADGLRAAAALFGAADDTEARRLVDAHGITHIVVPSWEAPGPPLHGRHHWLERLLSGAAADWLEPLEWRGEAGGVLRGLDVHVWEVRRTAAPAETGRHVPPAARPFPGAGDPAPARTGLASGSRFR